MLAKIVGFLKKLAVLVLQLLPDSPFKAFIDGLGELPYLGYLNYFFPVQTCISILLAWTGAIALFYIVSAALRWVKAID